MIRLTRRLTLRGTSLRRASVFAIAAMAAIQFAVPAQALTLDQVPPVLKGSGGATVIKVTEKPGVRTTTTTKKSSGGPRVKKSTDVVPKTKPAPYKGQDVCHITQIPGHYASGARKSKAVERAIRKWAGEVAKVKGGRWNNWNLAKNKHIDCGSGFATIKKCIVYAVPCLSRRSSTKTKPIN